MKTIDRKAFLAAKVNVPRETVEVPELGGAVIVQGMTGKEQAALYRGATKKGGVIDEEFTARLIAACLVDKDGNRLLEDAEWEQVYKLSQSFSAVAQAAMRVNGLGDKAGN